MSGTFAGAKNPVMKQKSKHLSPHRVSDARGRPPSNKQGNTHVADGGKGMKNRKW